MLLESPSTVQPLNQQVQQFSMEPGPVETKDAALELVIQDTHRAEKFISARLWMSEWRVAKGLYEAPIRQDYWRDTLVPRASNSYPLCAQHVRAILDQVMPAIFPEDPPFMLQPRPGVQREIARGWEEIIGFQLKQAKVKAQIRLIAKDGEIFGTGIGKWGWETYTKKTIRYKRDVKPQKIKLPGQGRGYLYVHTKESDALDEHPVEETVNRPFFKRVEINHVLIAPGLREPDITQAAYVVYRDYLTIRDLNRLRDFEGYTIPSEEELKALATPPAEQAETAAVENEATAYPAQGHRPLPRYIDESDDPLEHKMEVLEHWTPDNVIVVLQRKKVIRNEANQFGIIPFVNCTWDDIPGTFYGFGIPRRIGSTQIHIQGLRNLRLDDVNLNLQNVWLEKRGANISGQPIKIYPGSRIKLDDMEGLKPLIKQPILQEAYREEQVLVSDAEKTSGANELLVQGALPPTGRTSMGRTAGGANLLGQGSSAHIQAYVDNIVDQVFLSTCYAFMHMDRFLMEPEVMRKIVGKSLWQSMEGSYNGDFLVDMVNGAVDLEFTPLAGTSIAAKRNLAQSLPLEMQMFQQPEARQGLADAGYKVNWLELFRRVEQCTGWKSTEDVIIPLTPQDMQRRAMMNPEVVKGQIANQRIGLLNKGKQDLSAQEHQQKLQEIDAKGLAGSGSEIITRAIERSAQREEMGLMSGTLGGTP